MLRDIIPYFLWPLNPFQPPSNALFWGDILFLLVVIAGLWGSLVYVLIYKQKIKARQRLSATAISINCFLVLISICFSNLNRCDTTYTLVFSMITIAGLVSIGIWYLCMRIVKNRTIQLSNPKMIFLVVISTVCVISFQIYLGALHLKKCGDGIGWDLL